MDNSEVLGMSNPQFKVIRDEKGEISLIPVAWMINQDEAYWPFWTSHSKINNAIAKKQSPDPEKWSKFKITKIFGQAGRHKYFQNSLYLPYT